MEDKVLDWKDFLNLIRTCKTSQTNPTIVGFESQGFHLHGRKYKRIPHLQLAGMYATLGIDVS